MNGELRETIRAFLPRRIRAHTIRRGPLRGARLHTSWHDYPGAILGTTEASLLAWFARHVKSGETWLDVGAHYGYTSIALAKLVGARGRVFAFEPVAATAACIARTRELNQLSQLRVVPVGLSSDPEIARHSLPLSRGMANSIGSPTAPHAEIPAVSLDSMWESLSEGDPPIHGVKIDVQGMEAEALSGMRNLLCQWHPKLVVEFHRGVERPRVVDLIAGCGYAPTPMPIQAGPNEIEDDKSYAFFPCAD